MTSGALENEKYWYSPLALVKEHITCGEDNEMREEQLRVTL